MIYDAFHCVFFGMAPPKKIYIIWNGFWWSWFLFLSFLGGYPLVIQRFANWNITIIFIGESSRLSSILFAISHSYINHPVCLEIGSTHNYRNYYRYYSNLIGKMMIYPQYRHNMPSFNREHDENPMDWDGFRATPFSDKAPGLLEWPLQVWPPSSAAGRPTSFGFLQSLGMMVTIHKNGGIIGWGPQDS